MVLRWLSATYSSMHGRNIKPNKSTIPYIFDIQIEDASLHQLLAPVLTCLFNHCQIYLYVMGLLTSPLMEQIDKITVNEVFFEFLRLRGICSEVMVYIFRHCGVIRYHIENLSITSRLNTITYQIIWIVNIYQLFCAYIYNVSSNIIRPHVCPLIA